MPMRLSPGFRSVYPLAIVLLVAAVFGGVPRLGWVDFDDTVNVTENPRFFPVTWSGLRAFWLGPYESLYIPASYMVYAMEAVIDRWLAGAEPAGPLRPQVFHTVSLLMHTGAALLVWQVLRGCGCAGRPAWLGTAVFAAHPLQVEAVAWVSEQRGLLSALFSLLAIRDVLHGHRREEERSRPRFAAGTTWFCLALLAKPSAVTVPLITWLLVTATTRPTRRLTGWMGAWLCLAALAAMVTSFVQPHGLPPEWVSPQARLFVVADAVWFYTGKLVWPVGLCATYGRTPADVLADPAAAWRAATVYGASMAVLFLPWARPIRRAVLLCVVPLLPVLGLVPFVYQNQSIVADRYAYLSLVGVAWCVATIVGGLNRAVGGLGGPVGVRCALAATATAGLACLALGAHRQVACWQDTGALARQAVAVNPRNVAGWTMLASYELGEGRAAEAAAHARQAVATAPGNAVALFALYEACERLGDDAGSRAARDRLGPLGYPPEEMATVFFSRGLVHLAARRLEEACGSFRLAAALNPDHEWATVNLGMVLTRMGRPREAIGILGDHAAAHPDRSAAWVGLGNAFVAAGSPEQAIVCYTRSLAIEADDPAVLVNRAIAKEQVGDAAGAGEDRARAAGVFSRRE